MNFIRSIKRSANSLSLGLALGLGVAVAPHPVQAQSDIRGANLFHGVPTVSPIVTAAARSNQTSTAIAANAIAIKPGYGLAFTANLTPASSSTATMTYEVALSYDGTNFCTDTPLVAVFTCKGASSIRCHTNWSAALVEGARLASLTAVTNATAVTVTNNSAGLSVVK